MPVAESSYSAPTFLELVPEELDLRVYRHAVETADGPVPCWSYVTDGLRRFGQKEIVFTLRRRPGEADDAIPRDPLDYFLLLHRQAREGKSVEAGGYSRFARPGGFFGREGPIGMTYMPAATLRGVNYPDRPLAAFLVFADEIEAIRAHGSYRLLSLLGFRSNYFPYPPWSDRHRQSVLGPKDVKASMLSQVPVATCRGLTARRHRNQLYVFLNDPKLAINVDKRLGGIEPDVPFALLIDPDPEARARLVWKPGMPVETIATDNRPNASLTGGFIAFLPSPVHPEGVHVCEDGFVVQLRPPTWRKVHRALVDGDELVVKGHGSAMNLVCGVSSDAEPVRQAGGHFFQPDEILRERIKSGELTWFERRVGHVVEDHFGDLPATDGEALSIFCMIKPGQQARFWIECRPDEIANGARNLLLRRLAALKPPPVAGPVAWAMRFDLWGGTGQPSHFAHMPGEWTTAFAPHEEPDIPDQILDRVWPAS